MLPYMGGKTRSLKHLIPVLQAHAQPGQPYIEPFVGGGSVLEAMFDPARPRVASDINRALICFYRAVQKGWLPPDEITEDDYARLKLANDPKDPTTAFAATQCAFAASWFAGYARTNDASGKQVNLAARGKRKILARRHLIEGVVFLHGGYQIHSEARDCLIYCDPPYDETAQYRGAAKNAFVSAAFWEWVRAMGRFNTVIVSEYGAPPDIECIAEWPTKIGFKGSDGKHIDRVERLFRVAPK